MADNDRNSRRDRDRLEDNPFIAFRRFADSQVSSLLNTVFTIPATIANYHNVHQAREACLFKKADETRCEKLQELEADISDLRHTGRELYRAGNVQELIKKSEELMKLDRIADDLRRDIVKQASENSSEHDDRELVHRVATNKGQEWGWDWGWGFPKPYDEQSATSHSNETLDSKRESLHQQTQQLFERLMPEIFGHASGRGDSDAAWGSTEANSMIRAMVGEKVWKEFQEFREDMMNEQIMREKRPQSTRPDSQPQTMSEEENIRYSPYVLDQDKDMQKAGVNWFDAWRDLMRAEQQESVDSSWPWQSRRVAPGYPKRVPWEDESTNDEPSYEYSHDHEDQHDEEPAATPMPKAGRLDPRHAERQNRSSTAAETELDAYEHLLSASNNVNSIKEANPSILSTLTTTERTVGPDGSVTTKTVLRKRFADGREESSESIQTQHGQDTTKSYYSWPGGESRSSAEHDQQNESNRPKKSGWFWSN